MKRENMGSDHGINLVTFCFREMTREEGLWESIPHQCPDGVTGEQQMRQGVIGGFVGSPRCAVSVETGFFYGLGINGKELSVKDAWQLGLIEDHHLDMCSTGELINEELIREVRLSGYVLYEAAIKACNVDLPKTLGKTESSVLSKLKKQHDPKEMHPYIYRTLLFGPIAKSLSKTEMAALVKLVRRGLIRAYKSFEGSNGYMLRFEIDGD